MKPYFDNKEAALLACSTALDEYPDHQKSLTAFEQLPPSVICTRENTSYSIDNKPPSPLIVRSLNELNNADRASTRVLDLGCSFGSQGLFLAANGFNVTAMDNKHFDLDIAHQIARSIGIAETNYKVKAGNALELPSTEKYDVIIAGMLLHFFKHEENRSIVRQMKSITQPNGLNLLSVYTTDNPDEEKQAGRQYLFQPNELKSLYSEPEWRNILYVERLNETPHDRSYGKIIVPTIAELIAKKTGPIQKLGQLTTHNQMDYLRRSDPEFYQSLMEMSGD